MVSASSIFEAKIILIKNNKIIITFFLLLGSEILFGSKILIYQSLPIHNPEFNHNSDQKANIRGIEYCLRNIIIEILLNIIRQKYQTQQHQHHATKRVFFQLIHFLADIRLIPIMQTKAKQNQKQEEKICDFCRPQRQNAHNDNHQNLSHH